MCILMGENIVFFVSGAVKVGIYDKSNVKTSF